MAYGTVPCPGSWEPIWCAGCPPTAAAPELVEQQTSAAAEILYALTRQRYGLCEVTLRPCAVDCRDQFARPGADWPYWSGQTWPTPALIGGAWFNLVCGGCPGSCSCSAISEAVLPGPVWDITTVRVDGSVIDPSGYRLDNHRRLVRIGGTWPRCNDLSRPDNGPGTWSVTARFGEPLPVSGRIALGELACQLIKACSGDDSCMLPAPVQQLVRQGITMTFLDPNEVFAAGRIGLYRVDLFIRAANPHGLQGRPQVFDPDGASTRYTGS